MEQDPKIQRQAPVIHIPDIHFKSLLPLKSISPLYLRPPGNSWSYFVAPGLKRVISIQVMGMKRPRPNQAHVTFNTFHSWAARLYSPFESAGQCR